MPKQTKFAALAAAAAIVAAAAPAASADTSSAGGTDQLAGFGRQSLTWQACGSFECATLTVPQNYLDPAGPVFHLPVVKAPATDPAHRVGTLFVNPGGPAQSGVGFVQNSLSTLSPNLLAHFDVVAWDRRGTAGSDPALHCQDDASLDAYNQLDPASPDVSALTQAGQAYAAACRADSATGLTSDMGTLQTALDTDVLRSAIGEAKISYLGFSYGTFQGAWYAQLFGTHLRSIVLDGMFNPALSAQQLIVGESASFENELKYYENARGNSAQIAALQARVRTTPLPVPGTTRTVGPAELATALEVTTVAPEVTWGMMDAALAQAASGDGTGLLGMVDFWNGRGPDGSHDGSEVDGQALWCTDRSWPTTADGWANLRAAAEAAGPDLGALRAESGLPCAGWTSPTDLPLPLTASAAPPIMVVSTTGDPATPYQWGVDAAHDFAHGVLLTFQGHGHTAYGRSNDCVTDAVDNDLIAGTAPANGTVC